MAIEPVRMRAVNKPWGSRDLKPWSLIEPAGAPIGEFWFERQNTTARQPDLLLKLLFTEEPLSIQVHPDDAFARSLGMENGKTEAWHILSAMAGAEIAVGLKRKVTAQQLRASIEDGSIQELVQWHPALEGDTVLVPAGTIHAIGPGLVLAEIQQRSDVTFRLFDYGRQRELHVNDAVSAAYAGPAGRQVAARALSEGRILLARSKYFVLERLELAPNSTWDLDAHSETWLFALHGEARVGTIDMSLGEAVFMDDERAVMAVGPAGLEALLAYPGPEPITDLLRRLQTTQVNSHLAVLPGEAVEQRAAAMGADR